MRTPYPEVWTWIRIGMHSLTGVLMVLVMLRALTETSGVKWPELVAAATVTVIYAFGASGVTERGGRGALWWLLALVASWCWLLWLVPEGVFLAFPLYFLAAHLLADKAAVLAVAVLSVIAVAGYSLHRGFNFGAAIGPILGGVVAAATVLGLRAVDRESERRGVLEERERLAREIHDTLAQGLSSINLLLGAASERLPEAEADGQVGQLVREARAVAVANLAEARRFVRALSPPALEGAPLVEALQRTVGEFPPAVLSVDGDVRPLTAAQEIAVVRVAREALNNVRKHARATRVSVTLSFLSDQVTLDVVDDGCGFDPAIVRGGYGLGSMRSRAQMLGGQLVVESTPGAGTAVAASWPVEGDHT